MIVVWWWFLMFLLIFFCGKEERGSVWECEREILLLLW